MDNFSNVLEYLETRSKIKVKIGKNTECFIRKMSLNRIKTLLGQYETNINTLTFDDYEKLRIERDFKNLLKKLKCFYSF